MAGYVPENILDEILSRVDIVEIISGFIPLKRAGRNFRTLCPFHHEKTPSFMVSSEKQIYHCFGCGESGNAFKFLMRYERLEFPEAVEILAKKAGVVLPKVEKQDSKTVSLITQLYKINELAALFYEHNLGTQEGISAKNYLLRRGLKPETINLFKLGFAFDKWDSLINYLRGKSIGLSLMEKAGLIITKEGGGFYDRFRNRIILPLLDVKSRVIGFGARAVDDSLPKYINSPETPVYIKGKNLYGLSFSKDCIKELDSVVIVEGYLDFIIPFQAGLKNCVATQGTALTTEQARLLKRYTHNVVMVYDADKAGEIATLRSLDLFIEEDMNVRVASLPKGFDPDSYVRKFGVENFKVKIKEAEDLFNYKLRILRSHYDIKNIDAKARLALSMLETLNKFKNAVLKSEYIKRLAEELDIREDALWQEARKLSRIKTDMNFTPTVDKKVLDMNPVEKLLIKLMLEETQLIDYVRNNFEPADLLDAKATKIVSIMFDFVSQGKHIEPATLMNYLSDEDISELISESVFTPDNLSIPHKEKIIDDCFKRLKKEKMRLRRLHLHEEIKSAQDLGDAERLQRLIEEFHYLIKGEGLQ
jgi:DNA primase